MATLADAVLLLHFAFVAFVAGGMALIWAGAWRGWRWVRNVWYRALHLAAICLVALEAIAGVVCPLTLWESVLRGQPGDPEALIPRLVARLLYWDLPGWVFTAVYVAFAAAALLTWHAVPPARHNPPPR